jgi:hypothetical protein
VLTVSADHGVRPPGVALAGPQGAAWRAAWRTVVLELYLTDLSARGPAGGGGGGGGPGEVGTTHGRGSAGGAGAGGCCRLLSCCRRGRSPQPQPLAGA